MPEWSGGHQLWTYRRRRSYRVTIRGRYVWCHTFRSHTHLFQLFFKDIFTDGLMLLARSINPSAPSFFQAKLSPYSMSNKFKANGSMLFFNCLFIFPILTIFNVGVDSSRDTIIDTSPKKLEWTLTPELRIGIRFAETRLSDLICQNDCQALEFKGYGKVGKMNSCSATTHIISRISLHVTVSVRMLSYKWRFKQRTLVSMVKSFFWLSISYN